MMRMGWFGATLILGGLLVLAPQVMSGPEGVFWRIFTPTARAATAAARETRSLVDLIRSIRTLHQENQALRDENMRLLAELARRENVDHENATLRSEIGLSQVARDRFEITPATVIGRSPATFLQSIIIDQGSNNGITSGQAVIAQGFLIGRTTEVTATSAKVELITASRSLIPIITTQSRATGLLKGGLAGLTGEEFTTDTMIIPGEAVTTSPIGQILPDGIAVGSVVRKISADTDIVMRLEIHSPVEFSKLETVFVLRPK